MNKVPVCHNASHVSYYAKENKDKKLCLFFADYPEHRWDNSMTRRYMNQIGDGLAYLPMNIKGGDLETIEDVYRLMATSSQIIAINHTKPHKGNSRMEQFADQNSPYIADVILKIDGKPTLMNLNGTAFVDWCKKTLTGFKGKQVVLLGAGGSGGAIAEKIALEESPKSLHLVDLLPKTELTNRLVGRGVPAKYFQKLTDFRLTSKRDDIVFANCSGMDGVNDPTTISFLEEHGAKDNSFVDIETDKKVKTVIAARNLGWRAADGVGMALTNDYKLVTLMNQFHQTGLLTFAQFKKLVDAAADAKAAAMHGK